MPRFAAVLMDLDQTLIDSRESIIRSFEYAFKHELGIDLPRERVLRLWGHPLERQMVELAGPASAPRLVRVYREYLIAQDHLIAAFPDWVGVLTELRNRGYGLAVVTSKRRDMASRHLRVAGLASLVDVLVAVDDTAAHKPDPEPFLLAAARLSVRPGACLAVGDSPWDIIGARRAGMVAGLAEWDVQALQIRPDGADEPEAEPDIRLSSPVELLALCPPISP